MNNIQFDQAIYKKLCPRETEVALAAKEGLSIQQTAERLGIAIPTVQTYRSRAMRKTGCRNMTATVVALIAAGIL